MAESGQTQGWGCVFMFILVMPTEPGLRGPTDVPVPRVWESEGTYIFVSEL